MNELGLDRTFLPSDCKTWTKFIERVSQTYAHADEERDFFKRSLSLTHATLESSSEGILVLDRAQKIVEYNQQFIEMWKIPQSFLKMRDYGKVLDHILIQLKKPAAFMKQAKKLHATPNMGVKEVINLKDGRVFKFYSQPQELKSQTQGLVWCFRDVTEHISFEKKLEAQATHDALTSLPNRLLLIDRIQQAISIESRKGLSFGILFFDLDRFKLINDSLTHKAGDELLKAVAKRIRLAFRLEDTIARLGGDEFVMVALDIEKEKSIINIANKLIDLFNSPFKIFNQDIFVTASIGISLYPQNGKTVDVLLSNADMAMYHAKELGGNQFQFYTKGLNELAYDRLKKENELRNALINKEFFLSYQPQFKALTQEVTCVEALVRWSHPQKGVLLPHDFVPIAEETGLIIPLGEWVMMEACKQGKLWQDMNLPPIRVAINISKSQIKQIDFLTRVKKILQKTGLKAEYLEIEISENVVISNPEVIKIISELKKIGVTIALDDFGTGTSSLNYLKKLQVDSLKIDQSFIQNISLDKNDEVIIKAIIDMAHGLNYEVLAEGIETEEQLNFLKKKKCEKVQGYFLAKPMSSEEIQHFFRKSLPNGKSYKASRLL